MIKQKNIFRKTEATNWLKRNKDKLPPSNDPIYGLIQSSGIQFTSVLEVGCANGWRLERLRDFYGCKIEGIDPGADHHEWIKVGTADKIGYNNNSFDLVIYGFCLYLVDRVDLFKAVSEGDRVLKDGGHLIIHDFHPDYPHKVKYKHKEGLFSYKMKYRELWWANPSYSLVDETIIGSDDDQTSVTILRKNIDKGWPLR